MIWTAPRAKKTTKTRPVNPAKAWRLVRWPDAILAATIIACTSPVYAQELTAGRIALAPRLEDLDGRMPPNPTQASDRGVFFEFTNILRRIGGNFSGTDQQAAIAGLRTEDPDITTVALHTAALRDVPVRRSTDTNALRSFLSGEAQKAVTDDAKSRSAALTRLSSGVSFNLDLNPIFGRKSRAVVHAAPVPVRYGLIVKDITPDFNAPRKAAYGQGIDQELADAGQANVAWTIGPLTDSGTHRIFPDTSVNPETETWLWPSAAFRTAVMPEGLNNFAKINSKTDSGARWRLDLMQDDGLYTLTLRTKLTGARTGIEHLVRIPLLGSLAAGRRFDEHGKSVETSLFNLLVQPHRAMVNAHYITKERRYRAEAGKKVGNHTLAIEGRGRAAPGSVANAPDAAASYLVKLDTLF